MLKSTIFFLAIAFLTYCVAFGLAFKEKPEPPQSQPTETAVALALPQSQPQAFPAVEGPGTRDPKKKPDAPLRVRKSCPPEIVEEAKEFIDRFKYYAISEDPNFRGKVISQLAEMGIKADADDVDLMERLDAAIATAHKETSEWGKESRALIEEIADSMDISGEFEAIDRSNRKSPERKEERPYLIHSRPTQGGEIRRYVITGKSYPEYFAESEMRRRDIVEALFSEAIAAVRESEGE